MEAMRRTVAIECSLAVLLAFLLAPFQHVHPGDHHDGESGEIHAHFFVAHARTEHHKASDGVQIEADDDDDHAHARSLDTYTLVIPDAPQAFLPLRVRIAPPPEKNAFPPLQWIEARANSPPLTQSAPRPPPL